MSPSFSRVVVARTITLCSFAMVTVGLLTGGRGGSSGAQFGITRGVTEAFAATANHLRAATDPGDDTRRALAVLESLRGRSGKLRAKLAARSSNRVSLFTLLLGDSLGRTPGVHLVDSAGTRHFALITMRDFAEKLDGRIGAYRIGYWPAESGATLRGRYGNPEGFIEVTRENMNTRVSEHFRLADFLTKDQPHVWPKYLVLQEDLIDKLELVIVQLEAEGHPVKRMRVMSGFRTPQYNARGGETSGRSSLSRHMYGDAADVFVDNDDDGRMDDLTRDGRIDHRDARVILDAAERVERLYPDMVGGVGVYRATSSHGPFAHVDVRGYRSRWGML